VDLNEDDDPTAMVAKYYGEFLSNMDLSVSKALFPSISTEFLLVPKNQLKCHLFKPCSSHLNHSSCFYGVYSCLIPRTFLAGIGWWCLPITY
jgi:hypothetical protein